DTRTANDGRAPRIDEPPLRSTRRASAERCFDPVAAVLLPSDAPPVAFRPPYRRGPTTFDYPSPDAGATPGTPRALFFLRRAPNSSNPASFAANSSSDNRFAASSAAVRLASAGAGLSVLIPNANRSVTTTRLCALA